MCLWFISLALAFSESLLNSDEQLSRYGNMENIYTALAFSNDQQPDLFSTASLCVLQNKIQVNYAKLTKGKTCFVSLI